jgi:ABC-2 type transport system ATP-binding protein
LHQSLPPPLPPETLRAQSRRPDARSVLLLPALWVAPAAAQAAPEVEVVPLTFTVPAGPDDIPCTIVGDLYLPKSVSKEAPAAAILATNGFGGSKNDGGRARQRHGRRHYARARLRRAVVLRARLRRAAAARSRSTSASGTARSATPSRSSSAAARAWRTRDGQPYDVGGIVRTEPGLPFDPVLGMIGVSYGGEVQFATASFGRVDTIVPQITWNDLATRWRRATSASCARRPTRAR